MTLTIRREQMLALKAGALREFRERLRMHLQDYLASRAISLDPSMLDRHIALALERAPRFSLNRECDIARLLEIGCSYFKPDAPEWECRQSLQILCDDGATPEQKLESFAQWAALPASKRKIKRR